MIEYQAPHNFQIALTREQMIGESRAFRTCAEEPQVVYDALVKKSNENQQK